MKPFFARAHAPTFLVICAVAAVYPQGTAHAQLLGASVNGSMQFAGAGVNYFDPANGFVPAGFSNTAPGTNVVTIAEPAIEFGFDDDSNRNTANFTGSTLTLTDQASPGINTSVTYRFSSAVFVGLSLSELSDTFENGGATGTLVGDTITIVTPQFVSGGTFTAVYSLTAAAPEPGTLAQLALGIFAGGIILRQRKA